MDKTTMASVQKVPMAWGSGTTDTDYMAKRLELRAGIAPSRQEGQLLFFRPRCCEDGASVVGVHDRAQREGGKSSMWRTVHSTEV
jgi:hypothetical protein